MYDMYPEWAPARQRTERPDGDLQVLLQSVQSGLDRRDNGGQRAKDN